MKIKFLERSIVLAISILALAAISVGQANDVQTIDKSGQTDVKASETRSVDAVPANPDGETVAVADTSTNKFLPDPAASTTAKPVSVFPIGKKAANRQAGTNDGWQFAFAPYLYITGMSGTLGARGRTAEIDLSAIDVLESFKVGFMGAFEARKGKFVILNDFVWVRLKEERETPGGLYNTGSVGSNMIIWNPGVGYRAIESEAGSLDIIGGVRLTSVENTLEFTSGILPGFDVAQRKTWAAPVGGAHGVINLSPKIYLSGLFDVGGGFGTDFTGQVYGGAGYRIRPNIALIAGWRYLKNDYSNDSGYLFDTSMNGLITGARFSF